VSSNPGGTIEKSTWVLLGIREEQNKNEREKCETTMVNKWQRKDRRRRQMVDAYASSRLYVKAMLRDLRGGVEMQQTSKTRREKMPRDASSTRVQNRCVDTGRGRGVMTIFRRSRRVVRQIALSGQLPGVKKASW
jgi:small subunit ribosomal protein S14